MPTATNETPRDQLRRQIIEFIGDQRFVARAIMLKIYNRELTPDQARPFLKFAFRLAHFLYFFEYLTVYAVATGGRPFDPALVGNSPVLRSLFPLFSTWIQGAFGGGKLAMPPVNETQGMVLVSRMLDAVEAHLLCLRALSEAERVSEIRSRIEQAFQMRSSRWVFGPGFVSHIGHYVLAASLIQQQHAGRLADQAISIVRGKTVSPFMLDLFSEHLIDGQPPEVAYVELPSSRKRLACSDGTRATMHELLSESARFWSTDGKPFLRLDDRTRERGAAVLEELGVPADAPVVTMHVRESGYNRDVAADMQLRDARIADYGDAIDYLIGLGIHVVRLGDDSMTPAEPRPGFVDYALSPAKADWMDIYLVERCRYHIGTSSGMSYVPLMFGRPVLFSNWVTLCQLVCAPSVVSIPKVLVDRDRAVVPIGEFCDRHGAILERSDTLLHELALQDNAPDDILDGVRLMEQHLNGATGRLEFPRDLFSRQQAVFRASTLRLAPQIPPSYWDRYYGSESR